MERLIGEDSGGSAEEAGEAAGEEEEVDMAGAAGCAGVPAAEAAAAAPDDALTDGVRERALREDGESVGISVGGAEAGC